MHAQKTGLTPYVVEKAVYDTAGLVVVLPRKTSSTVLRVYLGTALVNFVGTDAGPFSELPVNTVLDLDVETTRLWVKGSGGNATVSIVALLNPID